MKAGSGRFEVWKNGMSIGIHNDILFGIGRYKAIELNKLLFNNELEYFHSIYIEKFATHGIVGLLCLIYMLYFVWKKVKKSEMNISTKSIIMSSLVSFYIFSIFETTTRFSIGYADSMFLIFFFTFPLIISNKMD